MELGQRLRQARQEAGLSQRQLCGDTITRNMLSQIENGSARPSMDTLRYLAARLGKPISWFLEEQTVSPNQTVMAQARQADDPLPILQAYRGPDPIFDSERWLLEALGCMKAAEKALGESKPGYARSLLDRAAAAGAQTPYFTPELERRRLFLCHAAGLPAGQVVSQLPALDEELLLRARAALEETEHDRCARLLDACQNRDGPWHFLKAECCFAQKDYSHAAEHYLLAEDYAPKAVFARLEVCYRELEDFRKAYYYACKLRQNGHGNI